MMVDFYNYMNNNDNNDAHFNFSSEISIISITENMPATLAATSSLRFTFELVLIL